MTQSVIQTLTKDGDDARALISFVYGQTFVVVTMLSTGLIWALILGWKLTLAGLGIAPVFALVMALQSRFSSISEARNKAAKEGVSKAYYESLKDVSAVRAMGGTGFKKAYESRFEKSVCGWSDEGGCEGSVCERDWAWSGEWDDIFCRGRIVLCWCGVDAEGCVWVFEDGGSVEFGRFFGYYWRAVDAF
jgi:ABC-type multidrug transport system fused ATPase/permease subunit